MFRSVFLIIPLFTLIASSTVQAQAIPNLSVSDRQRLSRDLIPSSSQDFFNQGRNQLEREIRLLERRSTTRKEDLLKIDPTLREQKIQGQRSEQSIIPAISHKHR